MDTKAAAIGLVVGIAGTLGYQAMTNRPDIQFDCSASAIDYECRFFNQGSGTGAMCISPKFERTKPIDNYVLKTAVGPYKGNNVCSGPLSKGQDSVRKDKGWYRPDGQGGNATELCQLKEGGASIAGCDLLVVVAAKTTD